MPTTPVKTRSVASNFSKGVLTPAQHYQLYKWCEDTDLMSFQSAKDVLAAVQKAVLPRMSMYHLQRAVEAVGKQLPIGPKGVPAQGIVLSEQQAVIDMLIRELVNLQVTLGVEVNPTLSALAQGRSA